MGQEDARFESESRFFPMMHFTRGKVLTGADQAGGRVQQGRWSLRVYTLHQPGEGGLRMPVPRAEEGTNQKTEVT